MAAPRSGQGRGGGKPQSQNSEYLQRRTSSVTLAPQGRAGTTNLWAMALHALLMSKRLLSRDQDSGSRCGDGVSCCISWRSYKGFATPLGVGAGLFIREIWEGLLCWQLLHSFIPGTDGRRRLCQGALQCALIKVSAEDPCACLQAADRCELCASVSRKGRGVAGLLLLLRLGVHVCMCACVQVCRGQGASRDMTDTQLTTSSHLPVSFIAAIASQHQATLFSLQGQSQVGQSWPIWPSLVKLGLLRLLRFGQHPLCVRQHH